MTGAASLLPGLLAECAVNGIRLSVAAGGGLDIDAPQDTLTPELLARLKSHKAVLLAMLRPATKALSIDPADVLWQAALDRLVGDPDFPPDVMEVLRVASLRWIDDALPSGPTIECVPVAKPNPAGPTTKPVCRCGSTTWRDMSIHSGQSVRRDCARCRRFLDFPVWYGRGTGRSGQCSI